MSLKFVPKGPINNIPALVPIMAWRRSGDKPLSEPMTVNLPTHICVTRPQWVMEKLSQLYEGPPDYHLTLNVDVQSLMRKNTCLISISCKYILKTLSAPFHTMHKLFLICFNFKTPNVDKWYQCKGTFHLDINTRLISLFMTSSIYWQADVPWDKDSDYRSNHNWPSVRDLPQYLFRAGKATSISMSTWWQHMMGFTTVILNQWRPEKHDKIPSNIQLALCLLVGLRPSPSVWL